MKSFLIITAAAFVFLSIGCGSDNPDPPAVKSISITEGWVRAGNFVTVSISYRDGAAKVGGELVSDPFSSVVTLPPGATYVEGSSMILFQSGRAPDARGTCPDGRTFLVYNFNPGEFVVPEGFNPFIAVLEINVVLQLEANKARLYTNASPEPAADPCAPLDDPSGVTFGVRS